MKIQTRSFCSMGAGRTKSPCELGFKGGDMALIHGSGAAVERDGLQGPARVQAAKRLPWGYRGSLEALLICDRTAARSDMGEVSEGRGHSPPLMRDQSAIRLDGAERAQYRLSATAGVSNRGRSGPFGKVGVVVQRTSCAPRNCPQAPSHVNQ